MTAGGRSLGEGIFQGDGVSPSPFIIAMMPLNQILWKCTAGYSLSRSQERTNHLMYMNDVKVFAKKGKRTRNSNTCS